MIPALLKDREILEKKLESYEVLLRAKNIDVPSINEYVINAACDKVSEEFLKYKKAMLDKGAELVFDYAYDINIAANIAYFFETLGSSAIISDEGMICILECALRDGFFEDIMSYATNANSFAVSDLEKTTEEIEAYCAEQVKELL